MQRLFQLHDLQQINRNYTSIKTFLILQKIQKLQQQMICLITSLVIVIYLVLVGLVNILKLRNNKGLLKIAFFHPFCNDGGGGQKVLWCMLQALLHNKNKQNKSYQIAIYSLVQNKDQILQKVKIRFAIDITKFKDQIQIIYVPGRNLLTPTGKLTMVFHMILPMIYALRCLIKYQPDVYYDTTGFASTLFLTKILLPKTKTVAYVHYPFISQDMILKVNQRKADFNNDSSISKSPLKTALKLIYYQIIFIVYKLNGYFVDFAQTNSSWTHNHMCLIWKHLQSKNQLIKLYPPCSVKDLLKFKKNTSSKQILLMSLAQFRPQKNHKCQINTMKKIVDYINAKKLDIKPKLYICGTTRGSDDQKIVQNLQNQTKQLKLQNYITFQVNKPFVDILKYFEQALIGIHTMEAEHFGISVVQMLAGGLIVVAHNSAGPKQDIVKDQRFLATAEQDYYDRLIKIIQANSQQKQQWIKQNKQKAERFSEIAFMDNFISLLQKQLGLKNKQN